MSRRIVHALAFVVSCGVGGAGASAALTPGALLDFDAFNNAGAASNEWTNNGTLGGKLLPESGGLPPAQVTDGGVTYYQSGGSVWGQSVEPVPATNPQITGINDFSAEIWLNRIGTGGGAEHQLFGFNSLGFTQYAQVIFREGAGHDDDAVIDVFLKGQLDTRVKSFDIGGESAAVANGAWTQLVVTYSDTSDTINVYRDGSLVGSAASAQDFDPSVLMDQMSIFKTYSAENNSRRFNGLISRVRLYNSELSLAQVGDNFAFGNTVPEPATGLLASVMVLAAGAGRRQRAR